MESLLDRRPPTWSELFLQDPARTLAKSLYQLRLSSIASPAPEHPVLNIVCISDTHGLTPALPSGDVLIHAGDLSQAGTFTEIQATLDWLSQQTHPHKVVVAGNHELLLDPNYCLDKRNADTNQRDLLNWHDLKYLQDEELVLQFAGGRRLKIYASPWTRRQGNWAFQYAHNDDKWSQTVPDDTDVLVTHMPPFAHQDIDGKGDECLLQEVKRVRPRLHIFGHLHGGHGLDKVSFDKFEAAFEGAMRQKSSYWNLLKMLSLLLLGFVFGVPRATTVMVNASIAGEYRGSFKEHRGHDAQVVQV